VVGLLVVLVFALFAPLKAPKSRHDTLDQLEEVSLWQKELEKVAYVSMSMFFWVVLLVLLVAIVWIFINTDKQRGTGRQRGRFVSKHIPSLLLFWIID
jgi:hypothetical protein